MSPSLSLQEHPAARRYLKTATVEVEFATSAGVLNTLEGAVPYDAGDALLTGIKGERWPVVRARFDGMYEPVPDQAGRWRKQGNRPVLALQLDKPAEISIRNGDARLCGNPGDWLVEYAPGDQAIVANDIFQDTYQEQPAL